MTNPYVIAAAVQTKPEVLRFTLSQDIRDVAARMHRLARYGVDLNQRRLPHTEKLQLRMKPRGVGGVLQICYQR